MYNKKFVAAVAQISPVYPLNCEATIEKAGEYISRAAKEGAKLIIFPECFLPAYPNWSIDLNNPKQWANNLLELTKNSVCADGAEINKFCTMARQHSIFIVNLAERNLASKKFYTSFILVVLSLSYFLVRKNIYN
ncbi:MAG: nitrilase-related carbon-nitrogen hydrolase [Desulfobacterales bacterium]